MPACCGWSCASCMRHPARRGRGSRSTSCGASQPARVSALAGGKRRDTLAGAARCDARHDVAAARRAGLSLPVSSPAMPRLSHLTSTLTLTTPDRSRPQPVSSRHPDEMAHRGTTLVVPQAGHVAWVSEDGTTTCPSLQVIQIPMTTLESKSASRNAVASVNANASIRSATSRISLKLTEVLDFVTGFPSEPSHRTNDLDGSTTCPLWGL